MSPGKRACRACRATRGPRFLEGLPSSPSPSPEPTETRPPGEGWAFQQPRSGTPEDQARLKALARRGVPSIALKGARARVTAMVAKLERGEVPCFALTRYGRVVAVLAPASSVESFAGVELGPRGDGLELAPEPAAEPGPAPAARKPRRGGCLE